MAQEQQERGQGRGNFGNHQEHVEAGRQSSGNTGNPEQHAEAGRKGGQNSHRNQDSEDDSE